MCVCVCGSCLRSRKERANTQVLVRIIFFLQTIKKMKSSSPISFLCVPVTGVQQPARMRRCSSEAAFFFLHFFVCTCDLGTVVRANSQIVVRLGYFTDFILLTFSSFFFVCTCDRSTVARANSQKLVRIGYFTEFDAARPCTPAEQISLA